MLLAESKVDVYKRQVIEFVDIRRIWIKLGSPGITDILIGSVAIAIQFKKARYRKILPLRIIIVGSKEIGRKMCIRDRAYSGASLYRDEIDARYMEEAKTGTAKYKGSITKSPGIIDKVRCV